MRNTDNLNAVEFLTTFRRGVLLQEMDEALQRVVTALRDHGGTGSVTLKLPFKVNKAGQLEIDPVVDAKLPRRAIGTGIYFASDDGKLTHRDPQQMDIDDYIDGPARLTTAK